MIIIVVGFINIIAITTITMLLDNCETQPTSKPHDQLTHWSMNNHPSQKIFFALISILLDYVLNGKGCLFGGGKNSRLGFLNQNYGAIMQHFGL